MKTIVAGSRDVRQYKLVKEAIEESGLEVTEVVSGCARGADNLGIVWAKVHKVPVEKFPAEWDRYGRSAGVIRNGEMAQYAEALIAIWDGRSFGTRNMIEKAEKEGLEVFVKIVSLD